MLVETAIHRIQMTRLVGDAGDTYNPPESGGFSLAQTTGIIPSWMRGFGEKPKVSEEESYETYVVDSGTKGIQKIEREVFVDRFGDEALVERSFSLLDNGSLSLQRVSTLVASESHGPKQEGVFYLHTQTRQQFDEDGGLHQRKNVVVDDVRECLRVDGIMFGWTRENKGYIYDK